MTLLTTENVFLEFSHVLEALRAPPGRPTSPGPRTKSDLTIPALIFVFF